MLPHDLRHLRRTVRSGELFAAIAEIVLGMVGGVGLVWAAAMIAIHFAR